ncbi:hypothetical protein O5O45_22670 [Hahella aquimaris]|uniref:hypothetical protein n=1 Tax=Hahella sp. HNIBRBA332 TaxID=3015983 RepID=UPI00273CE495|nr:hypothetical protein [Hahella sp. HNIBRBA332]WLQ12535.1 hypothetical protein O5O45_22670 [Hahella sp. HNIBRBA332]
MSDYKLADEGHGAHKYYFAYLISNPITPLIAFLVNGVWLGWPLFILGGWIAGNPRYIREIAAVVVGVTGSYLLAGLLLPLFAPDSLGYEGCLLVLVTWKLCITVYLFVSRSPWSDRSKFKDKDNEFDLVAAGVLAMAVGALDAPDHFSEIGRLVLMGII